MNGCANSPQERGVCEPGVAVCCSLLQCVVVCCSVLQCVAVSQEVMFHVALMNETQSSWKMFASRTSMSHATRMRGGVLQCAAVYCSMVQYVHTCVCVRDGFSCEGEHLSRIALQHTTTRCNTLQHAATRCNTRQHTAKHCNTLQQTATNSTTMHYTTAHYHTLQHTATHCNTL